MMASVHDILDKSFLNRPQEDKVRIMLAGKPRPHIGKVLHISDGKEPLKAVDVSYLYDKEEWLTACDKRNGLFCWPCLLFVEEHSQWNTCGFCDLKNFQDGMMKHKKSEQHAQGMLIYQLFLHRLLPPSNKEQSLVSQNTLINRDRELAKRIVDVVCLVVLQQLPSNMLKSNYKRFFVEDCIQNFNLLINSSTAEQDACNDAIKLLKASPSVLKDMVCAITSVLKESIKSEVRLSSFVSLVLNEHLDNNNEYNSKISTVLRYVINGKVCERFVGFTNHNQYKSATVIYEHISSVVEEFDFAEKFVAYAFDAGVLASSYHLNALKTKLHDDYPFCLYVPCHFHKLDKVVEQSLSRIKECNLFFKNVNSVKSFFENNSKARKSLNALVGESIIGVDDNEWCNSNFVRTLKMHRRQFIEFFKSFADNCESLDAEDFPKALSFQQMLQEFETIFLLEAFSKIFHCTSKLKDSLFSISPELKFGSIMHEDIKHSLEKEREERAFEDFWISVVCEILETQEPKPNSLETAMEPEKKLLHREFYLRIVDCVIQEIDYRYSHLKDLLFFQILNFEMYGKFVFSKECLDSLLSTYGSYFNEVWLQSEIHVLCTNNAIFRGKSLYELMELFVSAHLQTTLPHLFKLAELTLTMPCKPSSAARGPSKLEKISSWCWVTENEEKLFNFSVLCIEEEFLEELKNKDEFLKDVFKKFMELNKSIPLVLF